MTRVSSLSIYRFLAGVHQACGECNGVLAIDEQATSSFAISGKCSPSGLTVCSRMLVYGAIMLAALQEV